MKINPLFLTDSYKLSHKGFMTEGTEVIYSNLTPRSSKYLPVNKEDFDEKIVWFGLQAVLQQTVNIWNDNFFNRPKDVVIAETKRMFDAYLGQGAVEMEHFEELHDLGYLPIVIKSLPEGSRVDIKVPVMTIQNTDDRFAWLTNYLETYLSAQLWKPATVATIIREYRKLANDWATKTVGSVAGTEFQIHGFEFRGMSGWEDAAACAAGFLLSTNGTDTIPALPYLEQYYGVDVTKEFIATSVPASEHSLASTGIAVKGELETYRKWITQDYPTGIVSIIADTLDFFRVVTEFAMELKEDILNRQVNALGLAKVVFRPDCYDEDTKVLTNYGWKYFKDLTDNDLVAQVEYGEYSFVKPEKIISQDYQGIMHHFTDYHGKVDLLVTPNHRMILEQNGKERIVVAEKLGEKGHHKQKMARSAKAKTTTSGITPIERLKIAFQADGSYCTGLTSSIRFSFSKERKIERMKTLLEDCGLVYKVYTLSDGKSEFNIKVDANNFRKDFGWVDTHNLCGLWCEGFIEELKHWDSSVRNEGRFKFDTTNEKVIDVVEYIALAAGYGIFITKTQDNRSEEFSDVYTAHITSNNKIGGQSWVNKTIGHYSGKVYCVKVPSGKIIVKRNKCTMVCGNSGEPVKILCGDPEAEQGSPEHKGAVECLWDVFGGTTNELGYKHLNERVGLIYGDSITLERAKQIFERLEAKGFASTNVVFGVGSYTSQYLSRDSLGFAVKANAARVDGKWYELSKDPKTDDGTKKSAKGLLRVENENGKFVMYDQQTVEQEKQGLLRIVFKNGVLLNTESFDTIKQRLWS